VPEPTPAAAAPPPDDATREPRTRSGPGRVLVAVYALFAVAATSRAGFQILAQFDRARLAYLLSALAALVYVVATVALARSSRTSVRVATAAIGVELVGVLAVGAASYLHPSSFPDATVWSHFGQGYGFVPLVLPVLGLVFLRRVRSASATGSGGPGHR
jgi:hypothetical protein